METTRRQFIVRTSLTAAGVAAGTPAVSAAAREPVLALTGATVIDPSSGTTRRNQTVLIRGTRLIAIGHIPVPDGARVIELNGKYVIPGLADMHVHSLGDERISPPLYVANGVTTVREMAGNPATYDWRDRIENGTLLGPRMVVAGRVIDGSPTLWDTTLVPVISVDGVAQARAAVRQVKAEGADFVKVYSRLSPAEFHAIADEARRQRLTFAGHCPDDVPIGDASDAGERSLEHLHALALSVSSREAEIRRMIASITVEDGDYPGWFDQMHPIEWLASRTYDRNRAARLFGRLRRNRTRVVPTLAMHQVLDMPNDASPDDPRLKYVPVAEREGWKWVWETFYRPNRPAEELAQRRRLFEYRLRFARALGAAGVPVMAGTDTGTVNCFPGFSLHDELALLVRAGFSPMDALGSATVEPARFLGLPRPLRPGSQADLVVLDADPLTDIRNTQRIHSVTVRGRFIGPAERRRMLDAVESAAQEPPAPGAAVRRAGCCH
jgi:hypothetical protein